MTKRMATGIRRTWLILPLSLIAATLGACYETSYEKAVAALEAGGGGTGGTGNTGGSGGSGGTGGTGGTGGSGGTGSTGGSGGAIGFGPNFSEIQADLFTTTCATSGCHSGASPDGGLNLEAANSYMNLVGVASSQEPGIQRVVPNDPDNSYLVQKLEGTAASGAQMPPSGELDAADIATVRQWIIDGALDDRTPASTPIKVSSLSFTPGSTLTSAPTQITVEFDREVDASTVNTTTFVLEDSGGVAVAGTAVSVPAANRRSAVMDLSGATLADGTYRVILRGSGASFIMDLDANALDGEFSGGFPSGNDTAGGDFIAQFTLDTPVVINATLDDIQAAIFTPSCATSACHSATNQAAGLDLSDADTSYAEMVGQFSNQVGQSDVMLVAPNEPENSYLFRKIEGTPGISGGRMPPSGSLPRAEIDVIREWITNGAAR